MGKEVVIDFAVWIGLAIGDGVAELDVTVPVFVWRECPGAVGVGRECAAAFAECEASDGEGITIGIRGVGEELLGCDAEAAVLIHLAEMDWASDDRSVIAGLDDKGVASGVVR